MSYVRTGFGRIGLGASLDQRCPKLYLVKPTQRLSSAQIACFAEYIATLSKEKNLDGMKTWAKLVHPADRAAVYAQAKAMGANAGLMSELFKKYPAVGSSAPASAPAPASRPASTTWNPTWAKVSPTRATSIPTRSTPVPPTQPGHVAVQTVTSAQIAAMPPEQRAQYEKRSAAYQTARDAAESVVEHSGGQSTVVRGPTAAPTGGLFSGPLPWIIGGSALLAVVLLGRKKSTR